jgi:predicted ATPase
VSGPAAPRHQTLRALVDWSYELLFDDERRALAAVSVFRGRFGIADAEAVCVALASSATTSWTSSDDWRPSRWSSRTGDRCGCS